MRKIQCVLSCFLVLTMLLPLAVFAVGEEEGITVSVKDGDCFTGTFEAVFYAPDGSDMTVRLDGNKLPTEKVGTFVFHCNATEVDYNNSVFVCNGKEIGTVAGNGSYQFELDNALFSGDALRLTFLPSVGNNAVVDTRLVYGSYNIDDMILSDLKIELPSGEYLRPTEVILSYPIVGKAGTKDKSEAYTGGNLQVGDGWDPNTGMGGSTPEKPICFTAVFDLQNSDLAQNAGNTVRVELNTENYPDGEHTLSVVSGSTSKDVRILFDHTAPEITCSIESGALLTARDKIEATATDPNGATLEMKIDGNVYRAGNPIGHSLRDGKTHTFSVIAKDDLGNTSALVREFRIKDPAIWNRFSATKGASVTADGELYRVDPLENTADGNTFTVTVGDRKELVLHYAGTSDEGLMIRLSAKLPDGSCVKLADVQSGDDVYVPITVEASYVKDGKMTVKAEEYVYTSESDTMVWISDTQYYTRYPDLLNKYQADLDYYASLYREGNAGFLLHTGDVADEYAPQSQITAQLQAASELHAVLDEAGIPYGIVDGNHDVGQHLHDSSYFCKAFGASRFMGTSWYYGSLNNNESHYDLVTLGGYDFVLVWLGYGVEAEPETVAWANEVLQRFSHRNAILLTHAYLDVDADWVIDLAHPEAYTHSRAKEIWEQIVVPNANVQAVFCGHTPGVSRNLRRVDANRSVWEILADYQFYEDGTQPNHVENGMTCDGEGFVRLVRFTGTEMQQTTYSPFSGKENPFGAQDEFTVALELTPSKKAGLKTTAFEVYSVLDKTSVTGETPLEGEYLLLADTCTYTPGEEVKESDNSVLLWIVIALAAVIVVLVLVLVLVLKKRKHTKE